MKRWLIILIVLSTSALLGLMAILSFWTKKIKTGWFWFSLVFVAIVALIGIIVYFARTSGSEAKIEEEKPSIKFKDTNEIIGYAKKLLVNHDEPNYLSNTKVWRYTAGKTENNQSNSVYAIVQGDGEFYDANKGWLHYAIVMDMRSPKHFQIFHWQKDTPEDAIQNWLINMMEKSAENPRESREVTQRIIDPSTGRVVETTSPAPTRTEVAEQKKEEAESLEKK